MTRDEFIVDVVTYYDLYEFCSDNDIYGILDNYFDGDDLNEEVDYDLGENRDMAWHDIRYYLNNIPEGCDFYERVGSFDYIGYDNGGEEFENLKQTVLDRADENDLFELPELQEDSMSLEELWFGDDAKGVA